MEIQNNIEEETKSIGFKRCELIVSELKKLNKTEFTYMDIKNIIRKFVGMSNITILRYMSGLISFGMIHKIDEDKYVL